jgi:hypothetical protein
LPSFRPHCCAGSWAPSRPAQFSPERLQRRAQSQRHIEHCRCSRPSSIRLSVTSSFVAQHCRDRISRLLPTMLLTAVVWCSGPSYGSYRPVEDLVHVQLSSGHRRTVPVHLDCRNAWRRELRPLTSPSRRQRFLLYLLLAVTWSMENNVMSQEIDWLKCRNYFLRINVTCWMIIGPQSSYLFDLLSWF